MKRIWLLGTTCLLFVNSLFAAVISNISQLDSAAVFHFSIMSDNKGNGTENSHMQKCDSWIKNTSGIPSAFVIGLGDHTVTTSSTSDPFLSFIKNDSYWKTKFYPGIADGENQSFGGSQGNWGSGYKLFNYVDTFYSRANVTFRPKTSDPDDALVDYYAKVTVSGYNVHILNLHFADTYDGSMGGSNPFVEATQAFMQSKLESLAATKTDKDIIVVLAHSTGGDFVNQGNINTTRKNLLLSTADLCVSATTHKFGWWDRYKEYNNGNSAVSYNSGSVGNSGDQNGYMDIHVLANPTRITVQYISTVKTSRTLHTGVLGAQPDSGKYGTPIIKQIDGSWGVVDWNNLPISTAGTNGAAFVSQVVPSSMVAGTTTNVTVRMKNTGTATWSSADAHKLGSLNDSTTWGLVRVNVTNSVAPNQTNSFTFSITAPTTSGTYNFQWRMVDDAGSNVGWFGTTSTLQQITVTSGNQAPYFTSNPFSNPDATAGTAYSQSFSAKAVDPEGGTKTFSKVSGPEWMSVTTAGNAQGTPGSVDVGTNSFQVKVTDNGGLSATATMTIKVIASTTTVPWVTNLTEAAAGTAITNAGLVVSSVSREYHATVAAGKIFSQTPGGNTTVARGSSVALACSLGPQITNLVVNGSFETDTNGWKLVGSAYRTTSMAAGGGVASLRINTASSSATQYVAIVSGKTYDISVNVNVAARTAGNVVFDTGDKYDGAGQGQFVFSATNGGWKVYSGSFTATNNFLTVRMFSDSSFAGTAYFDLVELKPRP